MAKTPKEDPKAKAARLRERAIAGRERDDATQKLAAGMTSDVRQTYEQPFSLFNMLGQRK